jgi:hypothetical protein
MRIPSVLALAASFVLLAGSAAQAKPFCEKFPEAPICNGEDPVDPCEIDPASCEPDPCELDPASCEPEPDPCELDPASCPDPEPDPCEVDPASCEPQPEPEQFSHVANLEGTLSAKGKGVKRKVRGEYSVFLNEARFSMSTKTVELDGTLVPMNEKGTKFQLFLDSELTDNLATFLIEEVLVEEVPVEARSRAAEALRGQSTKLVLKLRRDGSAVLRIQSDVLLHGTDAIHFKANLAGPVEIAQPS